MKKLLKTFAFVGLLAFICLLNNGTASAANNPFTCSSNFYQVISGQLKLLNPVSGAYINIGSNAGFSYNAIGYNTLDNYIYGIATSGAGTSNLYRIANDGTMTDLGLPTGLPVTSTYVSGSMDLAGNLYLISGPSTVYKINVSTLTTTTSTLTGDPISGADNVFINNKLYMLNGTDLTIVDLNTNIAATVTVSGPSGWATSGSGFGAAWANQAGELFFSNNGTGSIYEIMNFDTPSPNAVFKVTGTVTSNNDGTNCTVAAQNPFDPPEATNDSYTALYNTPLDVSTTPTLSNDLGEGLTVTSNTNPTSATLSINADGTFLYTPNNGFTGTDSFDYTVTDSFGRTASATVTINVSASSIPKAPNTGYAAPESTQASFMTFATFGIMSILSGSILLILQRRRRINFLRG